MTTVERSTLSLSLRSFTQKPDGATRGPQSMKGEISGTDPWLFHPGMSLTGSEELAMKAFVSVACVLFLRCIVAVK